MVRLSSLTIRPVGPVSQAFTVHTNLWDIKEPTLVAKSGAYSSQCCGRASFHSLMCWLRSLMADSGCQRRLYMLMSDLTHRSLACKAHLNMSIENALHKFITIWRTKIAAQAQRASERKLVQVSKRGKFLKKL